MPRQARQLAGIGASDLPNQAAVDAYKGPPREIIVGAETLHVQDGVTAGGIRVANLDKTTRKLPLAYFPPASPIPVSLEQFGGDPSGQNPTANDAAVLKALKVIKESNYGGAFKLRDRGFYRVTDTIDFSSIVPGQSLFFGCDVAAGFGSQIQNVNSAPVPLFTANSAASDAETLVIAGFTVIAPTNNAAGARIGTIDNRPGVRLRDLKLYGYREGLTLSRSYAFEASNIVAGNIGGSVIEIAPDGTANNTLFSNVKAFFCGSALSKAPFRFLGAGDGEAGNALVINAMDIESCYSGAEFSNMHGVTINGYYAEYGPSELIVFSGPCSQFEAHALWLNGVADPSTGANSILTLANLSRSRLSGMLRRVTVAYDPAAYDLSARWKLGTGAVLSNQPALRPLSLTAPWVKSADSPPLGFRVRDDGMLELFGSIQGGNDYTVATNLPLGYRPSAPVEIPVGTMRTDADQVGQAVLQITTNGNIVARGIAAAGLTKLYLQGGFRLF